MNVLENSIVDTALEQSQWCRDEGEMVLVRKCESFVAAVEFVNEVARLAEAADHHPNIEIIWDTVTLRLSTHSAGGLTEMDLDLAARIEAIGSPDR